MYVIDCRNIRSYDDLIDAFNKSFIELIGGNWNGNLDSLNDYLAWPDPTPYELVILGADHCAEILNIRVSERHSKEIWLLVKDILTENQDWVHVNLR